MVGFFGASSVLPRGRATALANSRGYSLKVDDWLPCSGSPRKLPGIIAINLCSCLGGPVPVSTKSILLLFALCALATQQASAQQDLFTELTTNGIAFTEQIKPKLAPPSLTAQQTVEEQNSVLRSLAGKQEWSRFVRNSVNAPVVIVTEAIDSPDGTRVGLRVHSAFVLYGKLDTLRDKELMEQTFGRPGSTPESSGVVTEELAKDELRRLGFEAQSQSSATFAFLELPLLNKVLVRGVIRIEKRERPGAIEFVWQLDSSFNRSEKFASRWTRLERNPVGRLIEGETLPYQGAGGFMGVYEIDQAQEQLLVESRLILHEPVEWFAGSNFLRSKLPLAMQDNAHDLRRKLARSSKPE